MKIVTYRKQVTAPPSKVTTMKKTKIKKKEPVTTQLHSRRESTRRRISVNRKQLLSTKRRNRRNNSGREGRPHSACTASTETLSPARRKAWNISLGALLQKKKKTHKK
jgi:hypothetical protein